MKVKIEIRTPEGYAMKSFRKIKGFLLAFTGKATIDCYVNKKDDTMFLDVEGTPKQILRVTGNVHLYNKMPDLILKSKILKKGIKGYGKLIGDKVEDGDFLKLKEFWDNGTTIKIVKQASAEEIIEDDKTMWQKVKEKFHKVKWK